MTTEVLTEADKKYIIDGVNGFWSAYPSFLKDATARALVEAACGARDLSDGDRAEWVARILLRASDEAFQFRAKVSWKQPSFSEVGEAFEKFLKEGLEDALEDYDYEPKRYIAAPTADTYPLDAETRLLCQKVLAMTPYRMWAFIKSVEEYTTSAVRDNLISLTHGEEADSIAEAAQKGFERAYTKLVKELSA